jgi:hypothetical protein
LTKLRSTKNLFATTLTWSLALCVLAILPVAIAAAAKLLVSWKNPVYSGPKPHRVLVIGMSANPEVRADFEDDLSAAIKSDGLEAIPGNTIFFRSHSGELERDYLEGQIRDFKVDTVLVSRLVKVDKSITNVPGYSYAVPYAYYRSFYGYYGTVYQQVYIPGYLREDTAVRVETNFYSAIPPNSDLIWTGTSDSFNPKSAQKAIYGIVKLVVKELRKQGIL